MLVEEYVEVKISKKNIEHYKSKGYEVNLRDVVSIKTSELTKGSHQKVNVKCDFCNTVVPKVFKAYLNETKNETLPSACRNCQHHKSIPTWIEKYGVDNPNKSPEIRAKTVATNIDRYGGKSPTSSEAIREKTKNTNIDRYGTPYYSQTDEFAERQIDINMEKYGVPYLFQSKEFKETSKETQLEKYGVESYTQTDEYKAYFDKRWSEFKDSDRYSKWFEKRENTNMSKYGVKNVMSNPEIREKAMQSFYENGKTPVSRYQKKIHETIGGTLNYPARGYLLDIAFPEDKIYIEYDGGGHNLQVKFGKLTPDEFKSKEFTRFKKLISSSWKEVRIINYKDRKIDLILVKDFVDYAKSFLVEENYSIHFDFDNELITFNHNATISFEEFFEKFNKKEAIS